MAALTFSPPGSGEFTTGKVTDATTTNVVFLDIEGDTLVSLEISQNNVDFAPILTAQAEEVAGNKNRGFNIAVVVGWYIRARFRNVTGSPTVVVE